jgi:molybdenum cofactor cytidylyltransferase
VSSPVAAIIVAAGASRRLGQPKQLLVYGGETLIERAIRLANEAGASPVIAVLGAHRQEILTAIPEGAAECVFNDDWEQGISTSIHAGLTALDASAPCTQGALILSCDQPRLAAAHLGALIETFIAQPERSIVASAYANVLGVPAVFPRAAFPHLLAMRGDKGARALLLQPPCNLIALPFSGGEIDIDRPEDLAELS